MNAPAKTYTKLFAVVILMIASARLIAQDLPAGGNPEEEQNTFSNRELDQFIKAEHEVSEIQRSAEKEMVAILEEHDLNLDSFNQMLATRPPEDADTEYSDEKMTQFKTAVDKVMEIQQRSQLEVQNAIEKSGLQIRVYEAIKLASQTDPELQMRIQSLMEREG